MKRERERRGWRQAEFAEMLRAEGLDNFHPTTVSRLENGERTVRLGEALQIARVLGTPIDVLLRPHVEETARVLEAADDLGLQRSVLHREFVEYMTAFERLQTRLDELEEWEGSSDPATEDAAVAKIVQRVKARARRELKVSPDDVVAAAKKDAAQYPKLDPVDPTSTVNGRYVPPVADEDSDDGQ